MGWVVWEFCFLKSWVLLWSQLTAYMACLSALQQVCEPADAFWMLAVPSKSQWWVGFTVHLGQMYLGRAGTFISITTLAQHKFRIPGLCV